MLTHSHMCVLSPSAHSVPRHGSRHCRQEGEGNQHWDPLGLGGSWAGGPEAKLWGGKEERLPLGILSPTSSLQHSKKMSSERQHDPELDPRSHEPPETAPRQSLGRAEPNTDSEAQLASPGGGPPRTLPDAALKQLLWELCPREGCCVEKCEVTDLQLCCLYSTCATIVQGRFSSRS